MFLVLVCLHVFSSSCAQDYSKGNEQIFMKISGQVGVITQNKWLSIVDDVKTAAK